MGRKGKCVFVGCGRGGHLQTEMICNLEERGNVPGELEQASVCNEGNVRSC